MSVKLSLITVYNQDIMFSKHTDEGFPFSLFRSSQYQYINQRLLVLLNYLMQSNQFRISHRTQPFNYNFGSRLKIRDGSGLGLNG